MKKLCINCKHYQYIISITSKSAGCSLMTWAAYDKYKEENPKELEEYKEGIPPWCPGYEALDDDDQETSNTCEDPQDWGQCGECSSCLTRKHDGTW